MSLWVSRRFQGILLISLDSPLFSKGAIHFSVGAESIAANIKKWTSAYCRHIDLQIDHDRAVANATNFIKNVRPEVIGISTKIGSEDDLVLIIDKIAQIKNEIRRYQPKLVFGGVYATFAGEEVFRRAAQALRSPEDIFVLPRQGEYPLLELLKNNFTSANGIEGAIYYDLSSRTLPRLRPRQQGKFRIFPSRISLLPTRKR